LMARPHGIVVRSRSERAFQYWHLRLNVKLGQEVVAERTVLGWIHKPLFHVHLTEIDNHIVRNPLARGHLEPYRDHTKPRAVALDISDAGFPRLTQGGWVMPDDELA